LLVKVLEDRLVLEFQRNKLRHHLLVLNIVLLLLTHKTNRTKSSAQTQHQASDDLSAAIITMTRLHLRHSDILEEQAKLSNAPWQQQTSWKQARRESRMSFPTAQQRHQQQRLSWG
jgi:hypothetical protein